MRSCERKRAYAETLGYTQETLKVSNGWFANFQKRYKFIHVTLKGEGECMLVFCSELSRASAGGEQGGN